MTAQAGDTQMTSRAERIFELRKRAAAYRAQRKWLAFRAVHLELERLIRRQLRAEIRMEKAS